MMDMVETVSKAIFDAMDVTDGLDYSSAERYARAAMVAMRHPSAEVVEAGNVIVRRSLFNSTSVWEAMIDAALKP